ncbi:MAG: RecQ family ATP-dependent DNA helicase, partial [Peptostreptococcaceae bacterium]|nr:RecQ family ATP-dependent DNA helicase [Peptostreptococcaceae bacterium]
MQKEQLLKQYFGYDTFRDGQEPLMDNLLNGNDCIGVMPTGAGKSLCFQIPALLFEGITLVVSPLISLMKDQVQALVASGVAAAYINSSLSVSQTAKVFNNARKGLYKIIYIAPERLDVPEFQDFAQNAKISMVTIDEAHCVSQWGQDFRPSYLKINKFIDKLPKRPVISAFTATATSEVREDIIKILKLNNPFIMATGFNRENLYFEVQKPENKYKA